MIQEVSVIDPRLRDYALLLDRKDISSPLDLTTLLPGQIATVQHAATISIPEMTTGRAIRIVHAFTQLIDLTGVQKIAAHHGNLRFEASGGSSVRIVSQPLNQVILGIASGALSPSISVNVDDEVFIWTDYPSLGSLKSGLFLNPFFVAQNLDGSTSRGVNIFTRVLYEVWQQRWTNAVV